MKLRLVNGAHSQIAYLGAMAGWPTVDAAVATAFALAVVYPSAGNLGGGGFTIISLANREV